MYIKVETSEQHYLFESLWSEIGEEFGFIPEFYRETDRYLFVDKNGTAVGTLEFLAYNPSVYSNVEAFFNYSEHDKIKEKSSLNLYEVGKFCIKRKNRSLSLSKHIFWLLSEHAKTNNVDYYLSVLNPDLYSVFKLRYKLKMEVMGDIVYHSTISGVPILVDTYNLVDSIEKNIIKR